MAQDTQDAEDAQDAAAPILVVMGVSGCGKTTLARALARELGWDCEEGDALHPLANVEKMASGHPLDDADRAPWLARVRAWIEGHRAAGMPGIVTCSALKRAYRDRLCAPGVVFVHLDGPRAVIAERLRARRGHYMPASLLDSQIADLQPLGSDERGFVVDVRLDLREKVAQVLRRLG